MYYGWWIVIACMLAGMTGNALGLFGAGVYLHQVLLTNGWETGLVSGAVTLFYLVSALLLIPVGSGIARYGPQSVIALGGIAMAAGVAAIGQASAVWHAYLAFAIMGIGWACLSMTALATTLAPWFDKYQGRAMSLASLGASAGGMISVPALMFGISQVGFASTTAIAALLGLALLLPLAFVVLRHRPEDIGLLPDGLPKDPRAEAPSTLQVSRLTALRSNALRTVIAAFGLAMMIQIGFLTHQVSLLSQSLSGAAVSMTVLATAIAALVGRLALARFADDVDLRIVAAAVLLLAACCFGIMGLAQSPVVLVGGSIVAGLTVGNITTLSPIIVRREFGASVFGSVFGLASCGIQLMAAIGPSFYGLLHDASGSYRPALLLAAVIDVTAAVIVLTGRAKPRPSPPRPAP